ncbi:hypothetical protein MJM95_30810, partial [Salmonella enterica subsp. enterica serovar Anatum]|nr:hypothetical protein [Salmonella enterica subsp. enterica serovar Anatum]
KGGDEELYKKLNSAVFPSAQGGPLMHVIAGKAVALKEAMEPESVSVATTYREKLAEQGIIFCSFGEAIHDHPDLVRKYLGTVVP